MPGEPNKGRKKSVRKERGASAPDQRIVTIYETERIEKVAMLRMAFEDAGIPYMTANDVVSTVYPTDGMAMIRFQILEVDVERAQEVLRALGFV